MGWDDKGPDFSRMVKYASPELQKRIAEGLKARSKTAAAS